MAPLRFIYKNDNSLKLYKAFRPVWWFLICLGQMPFRVVNRGTQDRPFYNFVFHKISLNTLAYGITFLAFAIVWSFICCGLMKFVFANQTDKDLEFYDPIIKLSVYVPREKETMRVTLVSLVVTFGLMTITFLGFITVFVKGASYVRYFNYWNRVVQVTDIDATVGVRKHIILENVLCVFIVILFSCYCLSGFSESHPQGFAIPAQISNTVLSLFDIYYYDNDIKGRPYFIIAFFALVYGITGSRAQLLSFIFYTMLLRNSTCIWNERFRNLLKNSTLVTKKQSNRRCDYGNLFKDHLVLVQLFKMTENTFSIVLLVYYSVNVICIICDIYYLLDILVTPLLSNVEVGVLFWNETQGKFERAPKDFVIERVVNNNSATDNRLIEFTHVELISKFFFMLCLLFYQSYVTYSVTTQGSKAYEETMKGFDVLRRHRFMHCVNKTERNFLHSLVFSFARNNPMVITGGGYFTLDKTLILAIIANMVNFVVFLHQWKPQDWGDLEYGWNTVSR